MSLPDLDRSERTCFAGLARRWSEETEFLSSTSRIAEHPAFGEIVAMGDGAVSPLLESLEARPSILWIVALGSIIGTNPSPPEARGDVARMADAWLAWGREHGYRW